jgi:copper chaperone CopZ
VALPVHRAVAGAEQELRKGADMDTITIKTTGTHCPSCSMLIEMNVGELPGVSAVRASHADGTAEVSYDPAVTDVETIVQTIREAGYGAEVPA